ncbi:MAG: cupin domain-containing protein [Pseudomonadota bacterium]
MTMNGDLTRRATAATGTMEWTASPSGTVFRKRVHLVGPPEAGQVTSVVRYTPDSSFPTHDHPEGEEILVLDGVFSDEHGDWPTGTYLLNPEGFRHTPFSKPGCLLLVKLRQFPGLDREHHVIQTDELIWESVDEPGVDVKPLYRQAGYTDEMRLERWAPGTTRGSLNYPDGVEYFVIDGSFDDDEGSYDKAAWLRLPVDGSHAPRTTEGCTLYVKTGGLAYLRSS